MQASSPIRINEATADELCELPHIGPHRAERIARYRAEVGPIISIESLTAAAGLGPRQGQQISRLIDWRSDAEAGPKESGAIAFIALAICAFIIGYDLATSTLDVSSSSALLYNAAILFLLTGCALGAARLLLTSPNPLAEWFEGGALIGWGVGFALIAALTINWSFSDDPNSSSLRTLTSWKFALFALIVAVLQFGPTLAMKFDQWHVGTLARVFDYGQLPLSIAILLLTPIGNNQSLMEEIFCIWAGTSFVVAGWQMAHGRSSFEMLLNEHLQLEFRFLLREDNRGASPVRSHQRVAGITLAALGAMLAAASIINGWLM